MPDSEGERWVQAPSPRAKHDEPISAEAWELREKAKREAEETIARTLKERDG